MDGIYENETIIKQLINKMSLREKIGQTGMPSPAAVRNGVISEGGYVNYLKKYPYSGFYISSVGNVVRDDGSVMTEGQELARIMEDTAKNLDIPLFVTTDAEFGGGQLFHDMSMIPTNMAVGAANSAQLAYKRAYYWAKELRAVGINWVFGPVCDLLSNFFSFAGTRCLSDKTEWIVGLIPHMIRGINDAGMMSTAKHYPGAAKDYRDPHFSLAIEDTTREEWDQIIKPIWEAASKAGVDSFMTQHNAIAAIDNSVVRGKMLRPPSASTKAIEVLRKDIGFDGIVITDAVGMKGLSSVFEHDDIYIECFNAGNDIILFCGNDYIDVMEKAIADGRVSMQRLDEAVERILRYKKKMGLFEGKILGEAMSEADKETFRQTNYEISKLGGTMIKNDVSLIPVDSNKVKKASIIALAPSDSFHERLQYMQEAFAKYGVETEIVETIRYKNVLKEISEKSDLIVYACYIAWAEPQGLPGYSQMREIYTLLNGLSYGAEKSVVASFGSHTIYYNYFEGADTYINMYSSNKECMEAFVDGLFGAFKFTGKSPVDLKPKIMK